MKNKCLAYSYVRMSTEKQIKGDSLRRQVEWSKSYAARNDLGLQDQTFNDIGVSAWKGKNRTDGALGLFIERVKNGIIPSNSFLLVENLDRLSRMTPLEALDLFTDLLKSGITVVARGEWDDEEVYTWDTINRSTNQLQATISVMLRANRESERKSQLIRAAFDGKREKSLKGIKTNHAPPSWITPTKVAKGEYVYALNEKADTIRWIFEQSADGVGFDKIARMLNDKAIPTLRPSKRGWWYTNVAKVVESRSAIGEYQSLAEDKGKYLPKGDPIPGYYPAVVTNDLWLRAQKIAHRNRKGGRAGTRFSNLFDGLASCNHCQSPMYMQNNSRSGHQFQYLVCSANWRKLKSPDGTLVCQHGTFRFRYKQAEQLVLDNVAEFGISDHLRIKRASDELRQADEAIADLRMKLADIDRALRRFSLTFQEVNESELPDLVSVMKEREMEKKNTQMTLQTLEHERAVMVARQAQLDPASAIGAMRAEWETADNDDATRYGLRVRCNRAMREFIDFISFDGIEQTYTVVLFGGLRAYRFKNQSLVRGPVSQRPQVADLSLYVQAFPEQWTGDGVKRLKEFKEKTGI